jgi:hypothetical protein
LSQESEFSKQVKDADADGDDGDVVDNGEVVMMVVMMMMGMMVQVMGMMVQVMVVMMMMVMATNSV